MFVLALGLLGCGSKAPPGEPVPLLLGVDGCYAGGEQGMAAQLVASPEYGTRFGDRPVMWPVGFTGVRLKGGEVAVIDDKGKVVATTGRRYFMSYAPVYKAENAQLMERTEAFPAAANCGYPWDLKELH